MISIARILLVAPTVYCLLNHDYNNALLLFFIAGLSDGVDGLLARRFKWQTRLGAILDPIGDKLLLVSSFITLGWLDRLPMTLVALVILRDLVIVTGAVLYHFLIEDLPIQPEMISKINTALQITLVVTLIYSLSGLAFAGLVAPWLIETLIWAVYVSTIASGVAYVWLWGRRAIMARRKAGGV